jgi:serine/threonine-protein kinase RsbW/stage II sporulation protein AB (anti-sigma F factor)
VTATPAPFSAAFPAVAASVPAARHMTVEYLRTVQTPDPPLSDIALALSEALANSVVHAYTDRDPGEVRVTVHFVDDEVEIVVEDDGRGLLPRTDSPGIGLGLPLIARVADRFDTWTSPGEGTRLCIWFRRDQGEATLPE